MQPLPAKHIESRVSHQSLLACIQSIQGPPSAMPHGTIETPHGIDFSFSFSCRHTLLCTAGAQLAAYKLCPVVPGCVPTDTTGQQHANNQEATSLSQPATSSSQSATSVHAALKQHNIQEAYTQLLSKTKAEVRCVRYSRSRKCSRLCAHRSCQCRSCQCFGCNTGPCQTNEMLIGHAGKTGCSNDLRMLTGPVNA